MVGAVFAKQRKDRFLRSQVASQVAINRAVSSDSVLEGVTEVNHFDFQLIEDLPRENVYPPQDLLVSGQEA